MTEPPSTTHTEPPRSGRAARVFRHARVPLLLLAAAACIFVLLRVDLAPTVSPDFFFATDDPALASTQAIADTFPASEQIYIAARVEDPLADATLERIEALTARLEAVPGVDSVVSLTRGPGRPDLVPDSPLWGRLLLAEADPNATNLVVTLGDGSGGDMAHRDTGPRATVAAIEDILADIQAPSFTLEASGAPLVVEQVRLALARDLRTFSLAAVIVFGLLIALVYRSWIVVLGTLVACAAAAAFTLAGSHLLGTAIGVLSANIVTIVFVLTLSHIVFLTAHHDHVAGVGSERLERAIGRTLGPSFWAMTTTLLGFLSLRLASAQPLRELAIAGACATVAAMVAAFGIYPLFLARRPAAAAHTGPVRTVPVRAWPAWSVIAAAEVLALGVARLDTDPILLAFFDPQSAIHRGLERIDRAGGSSPLVMVVRDAESASSLLDDASHAKLRSLQSALEADPATGIVLSLPVLLDEALRVPLARFLGRPQLVELLASDQYDGIANGFIDAERRRALYLLRMREEGRTATRQEVIDRLAGAARGAGLEVDAVGGIYHLQSALAGLVAGSLVRGLGGLFVLFVLVAAVVARQVRTAAAMVGALVIVPCVLLGTMGWLGWPVDFISSPAANIALALGIDGMIHLVAAVRRRQRRGADRATAWSDARSLLGGPILGALTILAGGFGIFALSSFPPTARFGLAVALGTLTAAAAALLVMPWLATAGGARRR